MTVVMSIRPVSLPSLRFLARMKLAFPMGEHSLLASIVAALKCTPPSTRDQPHWSLRRAGPGIG